MSKIVVVFGSTGTQGGGVVDSILADPEAKAQFKIRGITRDVNSAKAKALAERGVEPFQAELDDAESIKKALEGAYACFAVTDFWAHGSIEKEIQQGKNVADAAKSVGLQHLVFSSLINVTEATNGKLKSVYHFDSKAIVEDYIRELGIPATFFQPGCYMSNMPSSLRKDPATGAYKLAYPMPGSRPIAMFDAAGDTGKYVKAILLRRDELLGKRVHAAAEDITPDEMIRQFTEVYPNTGKGASYVELPREVFKGILSSTGMPAASAEDLTEMFEFFGMNGYFNGASLEPSLAILKEPATTWREFIKKAPAFKDFN